MAQINLLFEWYEVCWGKSRSYERDLGTGITFYHHERNGGWLYFYWRSEQECQFFSILDGEVEYSMGTEYFLPLSTIT